MKCLKCGYEFSEGTFCPECGTPIDDATLKLKQEEIEKQEALAKEQRDLEITKAKAEQERLALERAEREIELARLNNEKIKLEQEQAQKKAEEDKIRAEQSSRTFNGVLYSSVEEMQNAKSKSEREAAEASHRKKVNLMAIWCLILSIVAILLGLTVVGAIATIIASIILGIFALKGKTEKKGCVIAGYIVDVLVIVALVLIVIWGNPLKDNSSNESDSVTDTRTNDDESEEDDERIDLYEIRDLSESELINELGFDKNDFGMYPDENNLAISYDVDGNIYIVIARDNKDDYEFCGLMIGDDLDSIDSSISKKFTYLGVYSTSGSDYIVYRDNKNENGYLRIEGSSRIVSINYFVTYEDITDMLDESEDMQTGDSEDDHEEEAVSTTPYDKDITGDYEMLIGQSFIYANIQWVSIQHDDYLYISIEGIDETGKEYIADGYLFECDGKYDCYFCYGNLKFMINVSGDTLDITTEDDPESYNREEKPIAYLFTGTYYKSYADVVGGSNDIYCVVAAPDGYVNFRTGPGTNYDIIMPIYNGEELLVTGSEGENSNWITVVYYDSNGIRYEGWVNQTQVKFE